jgi:carboxymethylenebutenolidase
MTVHDAIEDLETPTGPMRTYIYTPGDSRPAARYPGLILYSEIFQQTAPVRRLAVQFTGHGYVVMVPEVYHEHLAPGTVLGYDDAGKDKGNACKYSTPLSTFDNDAAVLVQALSRHVSCNGRLGAVGICLGGHLALRAALRPEILAAACFYATDLHSATLGAGKQDDSLRRLGEIRGELLMVWGRQDPHIPLEGRLKIYHALDAAAVRFTWHEFQGAHAFLRDEGPRYDPAASRLALELAIDLFHRVL